MKILLGAAIFLALTLGLVLPYVQALSGDGGCC